VTTAPRNASALAELPEHLRYVLHLRVVCGLSVDRVARLLDTDPNRVLLLQHEALNVLRRILRQSETVGQGAHLRNVTA
jgi:DNA-directed RNA polymerase specialized sigma24 family protein